MALHTPHMLLLSGPKQHLPPSPPCVQCVQRKLTEQVCQVLNVPKHHVSIMSYFILYHVKREEDVLVRCTCEMQLSASGVTFRIK